MVEYTRKELFKDIDLAIKNNFNNVEIKHREDWMRYTMSNKGFSKFDIIELEIYVNVETLEVTVCKTSHLFQKAFITDDELAVISTIRSLIRAYKANGGELNA